MIEETPTETTITKVDVAEVGCVVTFKEFGSLYIKEYPTEPKVGDTAGLYWNGWGSAIRGLAVNGELFYYETVEGHKVKGQLGLFGASAQEWVDRWDNGDNIWSIEMGGFGPGYEQAIQITVVEIVRLLLEKKVPQDTQKWTEEFRKEFDAQLFEIPQLKKLGLSGAQFGAAMGLAAKMYSSGPYAIMTDEEVKDRHIQVCKNFPS